MTQANLPEGTHHYVDMEIEEWEGVRPHDYEIEVNWKCYEACQRAFPDADVTHMGYPENYVLVTPAGCIEGLRIDTIAYAADEDMVELIAEYKRMTDTTQQLEFPLG